MTEFRNVLIDGDANDGEYPAKVKETCSRWRPR